MKPQVHGHEVMEMMLSKGESYTKETLISTITETFGEDTRFYTCSCEGMTASQLVDFLESRGKFVEQGSGFNTHVDKICNH